MLVELLSSMILHNEDASQHNETTHMHKTMSLLLYALWLVISPLIIFHLFFDLDQYKSTINIFIFMQSHH